MNPVLQSCAASPLKTLLYQTSSTDVFSYGVKSNLPAMSRTRVRVSPNSASIDFGQTLQFTAPRYGICCGMYGVFTIRVWRHKGAANAAQRFCNFLGCFLGEKWALNTHNKVLQTLTSEMLLHDATYGVDAGKRKLNSLILEEEPDHLLYQGNWANHLAGAEDYRDVKICVPLPFWQFGSSQSYPDLSFIEPLTVSCKLVGSKSDLMASSTVVSDPGGVGAGPAVDDATTGWQYKKVELVCEFLAVSDAERKKITDSNYSLSKPLTMLSTDGYVEAVSNYTIPGDAAADGTNAHLTAPITMKCDIKTNGLCTNTYFRIVETTANRRTAVNAAAGQPGLPIDPYFNKGKAIPGVWTDYGSDAVIAPADFAFARSGAGQSDATFSIADPRTATQIGNDDDLTTAQQLAVVTAPVSVPATANKTYCGWSEATISASGVDIATIHSDEQLLGFGGNMGRSVSSMQSIGASTNTRCIGDQDRYKGSTDGFTTFSWAMEAKPSGGQCDQGSISYKELVASQLSCVVPAHAATTHDRTFQLQVLHTTLGLLSTSSSDGRLTASISV